MQIRLISGRSMQPDDYEAWSRLQQSVSTPGFDSPYFSPRFTQLVSEVRTDVEVGLLEDGGELVGCFPFQRARFNVGRPVAGPLSDFHGVLMREGVDCDAAAVVAECGLSAWHFTHGLALQERGEQAAPGQPLVSDSPFIDLSRGFDAYARERRQAGSEELHRVGQKLRKLTREVGPLRFEWHCNHAKLLPTLIHWKSQQYRRTGLPNVFAFEWTVALMQKIVQEQADDFSGVLSALWAGDTLAAVCLSMHSRAVLHFWFPAFNRDLARYSPGILLFSEIMRAAADRGVRRIDLGRGCERFKGSLMSGALRVAEGAIDHSPVSRLLRRGWNSTRDWVRASRLRAPAQIPANFFRYSRDWLALN